MERTATPSAAKRRPISGPVAPWIRLKSTNATSALSASSYASFAAVAVPMASCPSDKTVFDRALQQPLVLDDQDIHHAYPIVLRERQKLRASILFLLKIFRATKVLVEIIHN
ncbi:hypothetical protein [Rhizobium wenxiniae]|uniref:hypothetical protein n=1 Tax=Rhizobium wenxiniae TaxID=1737357 RepID=UPI003C13AE8D